MTSQPGLKTIVMHILPNISRGKVNQTMKFQTVKRMQHDMHFS